MRHWRRFLAKVRSLGRRESLERDLDREVNAHLALLADDFERRGMAPAEARRAARTALGGMDQTKEIARDARSLVWLEQCLQDLRHAWRSLLHNPGFTLVAALTLALGIGVNATMFTAYNAVALKPLPVADPGKVARLERWLRSGGLGDIQYAFSYPEYVYCREHNDVFAGLVAASWPIRVAAEIEGSAENWQGELVSSNYFADLGIGARIGRVITPDEGSPAPPAIVLSDPFWRRRFNGDPGIVGRTLVISGTPFTIGGVAPEEFTGTSVGLQVPDFWAPLTAQKQLNPALDWLHDPKLMRLQILARLKPAVAWPRAQAEIDALVRQFGTTFPAADPTKAVTLQHTSFLGNTEDPRFQAGVAAAMLIVGLVLMAACANIANMLLARGAARQQEIAIRLALGASRRRVVRHLLAESLLLSLMGGALGLLFSAWASRGLWVLLQQTFAGPIASSLVIRLNLNPDIRVFAYTVALSLGAAAFFGLAPALRSSRADLAAPIKGEGSLFGARLSRRRMRAVLVAGQVAVSTLFLISAGLLARGMMRSLGTGPGFETRRVFLLSANFGSTPAKAAAMQRRILERLRTLPEVRDAALGTMPLLGTWTPPIVVEAPHTTLRGRTLAGYASADYLDTLGIPLVRGRMFTRPETERGDAVAVISESAARSFWPSQDPLGKTFQLDLNFRGDLTQFEVVGVAANVRSANLTRIDPARVYLPTKASEFYPNPMLVRARGDTGTAEAAVRRVVADLDHTIAPSIFMATLEDGPLRIQRSMAQLLATLGALLASLAMALAAVGIYGVMAFVVSQRIREIGVRMALGATSREVLGAVVGRGLRPVLVGIGIGVMAAGAFTFAVHTTLVSPESVDLFYGLPFYDPPTFLAASLFLVAVAAAASLFPARRALRVDPVAALRCQ